MRILLLGKNGQVGWELQRALAPIGHVIALDRSGQGGLSGDLADLDGLRFMLREFKPTVIVNAAAYTAVDRAEEECEMASLINAEAPRVLAEEAQTFDALLVHYSSDYVFDGSGKAPWQERDTPSPLNHYGASKLAGEQAIQASGCRYLIFRTSWVYSARGKNFLATMVNLIKTREALKVVCDQIGAPTGADLIADVTAHAIVRARNNASLEGLYHVVAAGETNWHGYATFIAEWFQRQGVDIQATPERIDPVPSNAWPTPATRPLNSRLSTEKLERVFGLALPSWQQGVARCLAER
ncbi:NAD(P)-dependent oxidoreductase [Litchfieldella qijiaojingensis]|uniref:dTDP-4-dehydrorhamnose reductase n=1 Tax=Litchfieldella qijiaojingensis TaxID=980347 RepID=A0ABQ2Z6J6_9GAMM|nr:dTDP-4-dehydrorhamnose reductase [Halomonas qijiaojingensis]GGY06609.1 NAD(P)-dependent oxidoreductase [Halomonas qijiaojingensis]